jgi:hypothetical protein
MTGASVASSPGWSSVQSRRYRFECPVRFADARGRVKMGEDSVVACDADLLPWCL